MNTVRAHSARGSGPRTLFAPTASLAELEAPAAMDSSTFSGMVVDQGRVLAIDSLQNTQADLASMPTSKATEAKAR